MSSSPYNKEVFACGVHDVVSKGEDHWVALFDMADVKEASKDFDKKVLKTRVELGKARVEGVPSHKSNIHSIVWEDNEPSEGLSGKDLVTADSETVIVWDMQAATGKL